MFQSQLNSQKLAELSQFLKKFALKIIESQDNTRKHGMNNQLMFAYTIVYELCNSKPSLQQKMLQQFKSSLVFFIDSYTQLRPLHTNTQSPTSSLYQSKDIFDWYNRLFTKFTRFLLQLGKKVFTYLDKFYLPAIDSGSLFKVGMRVFEKHVCNEGNMEFFMNEYIKQLRLIREKKIIESQRLFEFASSLAIINPQNLITKLTERYIRQSSQYYLSVFINSNNDKLTYSQYINKVYNLYLFEEVLVVKCVSLNLFEKLMVFGQFKRHLVQSYTGIFIVYGLKEMFNSKNVDTMRVVYQLYRKFQGLQKIRKAYYDLLIHQGHELIQTYLKTNNQPTNIPLKQSQQQQRQSLIQMFYQFYKSHLQLLTQGFEKDNQLLVTLNNAIQNLIAKQQKFATILYEYCSASRSIGMFAQNKIKITLLFQKISSKDEFISLYQNQLFKKIKTHQISINQQEEFVNYLNEMCGNELTLRLVKKINDSKEMANINEQIAMVSRSDTTTKMNLTVLSLQLWQKMFSDQITLNLNLPPILSSKWQHLQSFFLQKQLKRKLTPLPFDSILTLSIRFNTHTIEMKCNLMQAAVFVYIASRLYTSQEEIIMNLRLEKNILQATIEAIENVTDMLIKTTLGDYVVNWNWVPALQYKASKTINLIAKTTETTKLISKNVKQDRQILVQAAIVKFMKRTKTATFQEIAISVTQMIKLFKPQPSLIKASVDKLVKKGFIELTQNGLLQYVE